MKGRIAAIVISTMIMHSAYADRIERQSTYVSNGMNEIATWVIENEKVQPETICIREKASDRFMRCLDGAREIFAYGCLMQENDSYCDAYRWASKDKNYLNYRREINLNTPFSSEAKKLAPTL